MRCRLPSFRTVARLAVLLPPILCGASRLAAQQPAEVPRAGSIRGSVVDASTMTGLGGTTVTLVPLDGAGALPPTPRDVHFSNARSTTTSAAGEYLFASLAPGRYTMLVRRVGYEPVRLDVELSTGDASRLSVGLLVHPIALQAIDVRADRKVAAREPSLADGDSAGRIAAAIDRQQRFLGSDVRELTGADVHEALTLGSRDVLHAMQRLPGVSQVVDMEAPLWVRGNRWEHTRVYFDGMPLLHPLSAVSALSGVGAAAIGAAFLVPGVQPVSLGGGSAARIDLRSAAGIPDGRLHGDAGIDVYGGHASVGYRAADDRAGLLLAARQGMTNLLQGEDNPGSFTLTAKHTYDEVTARADVRTRWGRTETSGLYSHDDKLVSYREGVNRSRETLAGRVTHAVTLGGLAASGTIAATSFASSSDDQLLRRQLVDASMHRDSSEAGVRQVVAGVRVAGRADDPERQWQVGMDLVRTTADFRGPRQLLFWGDSLASDTAATMSGAHASVWAERRWRPTGKLTLETGLRLDLGGTDLPAARPSVSLQGRHALSEVTAVSLGAGRTMQYLQQVERPVYPGSDVAQPWLLAGGNVPLLTVDQLGGGLERWLASGILLAGNAFLRSSDGIVTRDPRPGLLGGRPFFVTGRELVGGAELSARKLTGRVTGMIAYSYQRGTTEAEGLRFPAPGVRPHALDATVMTRLRAWRLGTGLTIASGAMRTMYRTAGWPPSSDSSALAPFDPGEAGAPGARRELGLSGLDLFADWSRQLRRATLTIHGGTRWVFPAYDAGSGSVSPSTSWATYPFRRSLGMLPTLGVRIAF